VAAAAAEAGLPTTVAADLALFDAVDALRRDVWAALEAAADRGETFAAVAAPLPPAFGAAADIEPRLLRMAALRHAAGGPDALWASGLTRYDLPSGTLDVVRCSGCAAPLLRWVVAYDGAWPDDPLPTRHVLAAEAELASRGAAACAPCAARHAAAADADAARYAPRDAPQPLPEAPWETEHAASASALQDGRAPEFVERGREARPTVIVTEPC
jgi:hypothetical protein